MVFGNFTFLVLKTTDSQPVSCSVTTHATCPPELIIPSHVSAPVILQNIVGFLNFIVQLSAIKFVYTNKKFQKGAFFVLLITLSALVVFRTLFSIISLIFSSYLDKETTIYRLLTQSSLYVDYILTFFSMILIFLMSLNRCFLFISRDWNNIFFHKLRVTIPISISALLSVLASVIVIITSAIQRDFISFLGFIDTGKQSGLRNIINRLFYIFPIGSIVCYLILFYHIRQKTHGLTASSQQNRGERKVFVQILITAVLYGIMSVFNETLALLDLIGDPGTQIILIVCLNIFTYLPEMSLPLLLICGDSQLRTSISKLIAPKKSSIMVPTAQTTTSTSMR